MKKLLVLILAAAITLSLTACDKADNYSESNTDIGGENFSSASSESTGTNSTEQSAPDVPSAGANPIMLANNKRPSIDWANSFGTEDGIYNIKEEHNIVKIGTYSYIMYTDYATGQEVYLCSDSSCNHNTERCSSYLDNSEFIVNHESRLFVYNGSLYYLNIPKNNDVDTVTITGGTLYEEHHDPKLYRMDLDGSNRELVYTFDRELSVQPFAAGDGNALWFFVKTPTVEHDEERHAYFCNTKEPTLIKLDLSTRSIVEQIPLYKFKELEVISVWDCSDGKIIFCGRELPEGMTRQEINAMTDFDDPAADSIRVHELNERCQSVYFTLDLNNKDIKEIYRHKYGINNEYMGFTDGKYAYLTDTEKRTSVKIDLESGEQSAFSPAEGYVAVGMIGDKYDCRSIDKNDHTLYFIDRESGEITSNSLEALYLDKDWEMLHGDEYDYRPINKDVVAYGKGCVLIRSSEQFIYTDNSGHGYWEKECAVMSLDDYFNGRKNYRTVKSDFRENRN